MWIFLTVHRFLFALLTRASGKKITTSKRNLGNPLLHRGFSLLLFAILLIALFSSERTVQD
jgi:hypothetical protein